VTQPPAYGPPPGYPAAPFPAHGPYGPPGWPPPGPMSPSGAPLAEFGDRLLAFIIDAVLVGAVLTAVTVPSFFLVMTHLLPREDNGVPTPFTAFTSLLAFDAAFFLFAIAVWYVYAVELMFRRGQTLGKRLLKIRVIPLDPRRPMTRLLAFKRYAAQFLPSIFVGFYALIDDLWPLWDKPFQQALHDKAAQTVVVKVSA
jgi:uncharacterized RDD family membrane protein YckC